MASAGSGASADEREVKAKPAVSLPSLHPTTIAHIAFIDRRGGRPRPNENWRLRIRHDLPTGRAKRFQRFSNSGTYRITHRMMVVCDTATPRSVWSRRGCDLAWQDELQSRVQRLGDARLATQGRVLENQHAALGLVCGDQGGRPPAPLRALRRSARARARPACGAARARAHPILPTVNVIAEILSITDMNVKASKFAATSTRLHALLHARTRNSVRVKRCER
jgi:hypothetical protein